MSDKMVPNLFRIIGKFCPNIKSIANLPLHEEIYLGLGQEIESGKFQHLTDIGEANSNFDLEHCVPPASAKESFDL
jgi:hypothetical protein